MGGHSSRYRGCDGLDEGPCSHGIHLPVGEGRQPTVWKPMNKVISNNDGYHGNRKDDEVIVEMG